MEFHASRLFCVVRPTLQILQRWLRTATNVLRRSLGTSVDNRVHSVHVRCDVTSRGLTDWPAEEGCTARRQSYRGVDRIHSTVTGLEMSCIIRFYTSPPPGHYSPLGNTLEKTSAECSNIPKAKIWKLALTRGGFNMRRTFFLAQQKPIKPTSNS